MRIPCSCCALLFCLTLACSKQEPSPEQLRPQKAGVDTAASEQTLTVEEDALPAASVDLPVNDAEPGAEQASLQVWPSTLDPELPLLPSQLEQAFHAFDGKTLSVAGYPMLVTEQESLRGELGLTSAPWDGDHASGLLRCTMRADDQELVSKQQVVVLRGVAKGWDTIWNRFVLEDCQKVAVLEQMPPWTEQPELADAEPSLPIPVAQLIDSSVWKDRELTLLASFNGQITTAVGEQLSYRIELFDPGEDILTKRIAVFLEEPVAKGSMATNKVWKVRGRLSGTQVFGRPEVLGGRLEQVLD